MSGRTEFPKSVRREAWKRSGGLCEMVLAGGARCNCPLTTGKFAYDHVITDWMGGEAVLSNCQVICTPCHTEKTRQDAADIAKAKAPRGHAPRHHAPWEDPEPGLPEVRASAPCHDTDSQAEPFIQERNPMRKGATAQSMDLIGQKFGRLTVISLSGRIGSVIDSGCASVSVEERRRQLPARSGWATLGPAVAYLARLELRRSPSMATPPDAQDLLNIADGWP